MSTTQARDALIVAGGWPGHRPLEVAEIMARELRGEGFAPEVADSLTVLAERDRLAAADLVVLNWQLGVEDEQTRLDFAPLLDAVAGGTGLAGIHGGWLGNAFKLKYDFQYMVGGQLVALPGDDGVTYTVRIVDRSHPIAVGIDDFVVVSEKYYMHIDPAIHVIAATEYFGIDMPIAWTKPWGEGRVFYSSLGHALDIVEQPPALALMRQGFVWAARSPRAPAVAS
jgi:type 1 glutamine amidotransferase